MTRVASPALLLGVLLALLPSCRNPGEGSQPGDCSDALDNDNDGSFDCDDPGCAASPACTGDDDDSSGDDDDSSAQSAAFAMVAEAAGLFASDRELYAMGGSGAAVADVDGDGWPDLYLTGSLGPNGSVANRLYINNGDGSFVDRTELWGLPSGVPTTRGGDTVIAVGATFADYDNDGDPDLFLANDGANQLFRHQGTTFVDHSAASGLASQDVLSSAMVLGDYDGDGLLDLLEVHHQDYSLGDPQSFEQRPANRLSRNLGDGSFADVSPLLPQPTPYGAGFAAAWLDVDDDGDQDLYVANDHGHQLQPNQLYRNDGADGDGWLFTAVSSTCQCSLAASSMGIALGDYDRDGRVDLYVSNLLMDGGEVMLAGLGDGTFLDTSLSIGAVAALDGIRESSWGVEFLDFDNDGWQDLFVAFGSWQDNDFPSSNVLLRNVSAQFQVVTDSGTQAVAQASEGVARIDYDRDGCVDIVVANLDGQPELYRNLCQGSANWVGFDLQGTLSNRDAVGAVVILHSGTAQQRTQVSAGSTSVHSSSTRSLHFGLGAQTLAERVEVRWPSGLTEVFEGVVAGSYHRVVEGSGIVETAASSASNRR
jgi:hypothetical protein